MIGYAYDCLVKLFANEKGQDLIEYALLLAIVVGIGYLIYQSTEISAIVNSIFESASKLLKYVYELLPATVRFSES